MGRSISKFIELMASCSNSQSPFLLNYFKYHDPLLKKHDRYGHTALIVACDANHLQLVETLLESGASVDLADLDGVSPLSHAAATGDIKLVDLLLKYQAVFSVDQEGRTPLHHAAQVGHIDMVVYLLGQGGSLAKDNQGRTPVDYLHLLHIEAFNQSEHKAALLEKAHRSERVSTIKKEVSSGLTTYL